MARIPALRGASVLFAVAAVLSGCGGRTHADLTGAWWAGRRSAVQQVLAQLAELEGTPLARRAREIAETLPDCDAVGIHAPDGAIAALVGPARCLDPGDPLERALRAAGSDLAFATPGADGGPPIAGAARVEARALSIDLRWPRPPSEGISSLFVPGEEVAGPDRLAYSGRLVHLRVRPQGGIDLASLVPPGSQGDLLFRLRSDLFSSAVLDGTWEGAVYLPERAGGMPGVAIALGVKRRSAAVDAAERFVADLQETWSTRRSDFRLRAGEGACLPDVNVLPDLAPCYVATADALVVGWNAASLERALASAMMAAPDAAGRLDVNLALIHRADNLLARHFGGASPPLRWPWSRVLASGGLDGRALALRFTVLVAPKGES